MAVAIRRKRTLTVQQTDLLIDMVKSFPCIWNLDNEEYVHRTTIGSAWAEIAKRVELPEDLLRKKWKNLRDIFMRETKRTKLTRVEDYHGKWRHFKKLFFLYRLGIGEQTLSGDERSELTYVCEPTQEPYELKTEPQTIDVNEFEFLDTEQDTGGFLIEKRFSSDKNSKSDRDDTSDIFPEAQKRRRVNQVYTDEDCDMRFLMSLAPYFKLLSPIRKLVVRNKMQETILKEIEASAVKEQL